MANKLIPLNQMKQNKLQIKNEGSNFIAQSCLKH